MPNVFPRYAARVSTQVVGADLPDEVPFEWLAFFSGGTDTLLIGWPVAQAGARMRLNRIGVPQIQRFGT